MFYNKSIDAETDVDILRVALVEKYHWTLDYIDSIPLEDIYKLNAISEGLARYEKKMADQRARGIDT